MTSITIEIDGSHGSLLVHRATGAVLATLHGCNCGECGGGYPDILLFNPADYAAWPDVGSFDIVNVGYWDDQGRYEPATVIRQAFHPRYGMDFDAVVELALLPAPAKRSGDIPMSGDYVFRWMLQGTTHPEIYGWVEFNHMIARTGGFWRTADPMEAARRASGAFEIPMEPRA